MDDDPEISILDARLAEIDRRLHSIQSGLAEEDAPAEPVSRLAVPGDGPASTPAAAEMITRLRDLTTAQEGVLASMRELLGAVQRVAIADSAAPASPTARAPMSVSAGPFASTDALRSFQDALESLPEVRAVELRGFEGGDRAILDVHL